MYSADLADKAAEHDINFHVYADDTQLCVHCRPEEIAATTPKLERCITDMDNWMSANRLKLYGQDGAAVGWNKIQHVNV